MIIYLFLLFHTISLDVYVYILLRKIGGYTLKK